MLSIKLKINPILTLAFLIVLSMLFKKIFYAPLLITLFVIIFGSFIGKSIQDFICIVALLWVFPTLLVLFLFYLQFTVYGNVLNSPSFIKKYLFGYTISFFSAALAYVVSILIGIKINLFFIIAAYYLPLIIFLLRNLIKKNNIFHDYTINPKETTILICSFFLLILSSHFIINNENMYASNGTYMYTKFLTVFDGIKDIGIIPQYDPRIGEGEQLFLSDTPTFYSNLAFVNSILFWIPNILFFNSITSFILWLSLLGAWLLIFEILKKDEDYLTYFLSLIGASTIVLSFTFFQIFESFKQSSSYPHDFLGLSMLFSITNPADFFMSLIVFMVSFLIHPTKASGVILIGISLIPLIMLRLGFKQSISNIFEYSRKNKLKILFFAIILVLIPVFYLFPSYFYKNYARETEFSISQVKPIDYIKSFFHPTNTPLSVNYPDIHRLDQKKFGFFISFIGIFSIVAVFFNFKSSKTQNAAIFALAYFIHFILSSIISYIPPFPQAEYGYRTVMPYFLVTIVVCICALIYLFKNKFVKLTLLFVFVIFSAHGIYYASQNLTNIHGESVISGKTFENEISLIKQIPNDGRFISLGWYSNAVDMALSVQTDHYFSRYGYLQWDFSDNIYDKITTMNSFGVVDTIDPMTSNEFSNYLRLAGYKYAFLNICHPVGSLALQKLYPENSYPIYQNPNYKCIVILGINNSNYAEKVNLVAHVNESEYKNSDGYWHLTFNRNKKIHNFVLDPYLQNVVKSPNQPISLQFKRKDYNNIEIYGDFTSNDWVVFKEEYFPRWSASMDSKSVPLLATNNRMMLVKTDNGNKIELHYELLKEEKIAAFVSLPAIISIFLILVLV